MTEPGKALHYPEEFMARIHAVWGNEGFILPGGPEEVREIVEGLDLSAGALRRHR